MGYNALQGGFHILCEKSQRIGICKNYFFDIFLFRREEDNSSNCNLVRGCRILYEGFGSSFIPRLQYLFARRWPIRPQVDLADLSGITYGESFFPSRINKSDCPFWHPPNNKSFYPVPSRAHARGVCWSVCCNNIYQCWIVNLSKINSLINIYIRYFLQEYDLLPSFICRNMTYFLQEHDLFICLHRHKWFSNLRISTLERHWPIHLDCFNLHNFIFRHITGDKI